MSKLKKNGKKYAPYVLGGALTAAVTVAFVLQKNRMDHFSKRMYDMNLVLVSLMDTQDAMLDINDNMLDIDDDFNERMQNILGKLKKLNENNS